MSCEKFLGIVGAAIKPLPHIDENTLTYIEFSPNNGALRKLVIDSIEQNEDQVIVHLSNPTAMCKPFQRAMAKQSAKTQVEASCCVTPEPVKESMSCCES